MEALMKGDNSGINRGIDMERRVRSMVIDRRGALGLLGAGAFVARKVLAEDSGLHFTGLDHVEFTVSDVEKSLAFYVLIFGNTVMKNNQTTRRYLKLGGCYIAMDKTQNNQAEAIRVDHYCAGIQGFNIAGVHAYLQQSGIAYRDFPSGKDLAVADPDGIRTQLAANDGWSQLTTGTASPESVPAGASPIFRPTGLDHILLNVSDPEKSAAFYAKIFGPVTQRTTKADGNRIWFQAGKSRIGLLRTPRGQRPGVNHYCVSAEAFDYDAVVKKLEQAGAKVETPDVAGAPEFRDRDGFLVQVMRG
jgi:catechol 2,3-dioxygenase-like lactoylglutathione lyase family enzyme